MSDITAIRTWVESDEPEPEGGYDWPHPPIYVESAISGELRDRILAKLGRSGDDIQLRLVESEIEGGWSEFTVKTDYEIEVWLDRPGSEPERVWHRDMDGNAEAAMSAFLKWSETTERN